MPTRAAFDPAARPPPGAVAAYGIPSGPTGHRRSTLTVILLWVLTLGIAGWVWTYRVHTEMRAHTGRGLGGGRAMALAILLPAVIPFVTAHEVGTLYRARGVRPPVSAWTGLWVVPGAALVLGPVVWVVLVNGALNAYWARLAEA